MNTSENSRLLPKSSKKRMRLITVEPVLLLYSAIYAIQEAANQDLFSTKICFQYLNTTDVDLCRNISGSDRATVKSRTSQWLVYYNLLKTILPVMFSFWIGSWNEMLGWKWPLLLPSSLSVFSEINFLLFSVHPYLPTEMLLISPLLIGLSTDMVGLYCGCYGYISDTVDIKNRSKRMTILQASAVIGTATGGFITSFLMSRFNFVVVYTVIITVHAMIVLYILLFIQNIRSEGAKNPKGICDFFDLRNVTQSIRTVVRKREGSARTEILLLYTSLFFQFIGKECFLSMAYVFVTDEPIAWNADRYGLLNGLKGGMQSLGLMVILPLLFKYSGLKDHIAGTLSSASRMAGLMVMGFSTNGIMPFIAAGLMLFADADAAIGRSLMVSRVQSEEKGRILAFVGGLVSVAKLIVSTVSNATYPVYSTFFKGLAFEISGVLQLVPIAVFMYIRQGDKKKHPIQNKRGEQGEQSI